MAAQTPALKARLKSEGLEIFPLSVQPGSAEDAIQTTYLARQRDATWVVVDGYHFGADYQRIIKNSGLHLLFVDDHGHADHYYADLVLNQNIHVHKGWYAGRESHTRLLLGTCYVLLRRELLRWRGWKREIPESARKVLVTLGGSDPNNVTLKVIRALQQVKVDGLEAAVVVGDGNPHYDELQAAVQASRLPIRLESHVRNMSNLMVWADIAVSAGGSTCWECAFMGLPFVTIILAENQKPIAEGLEEAGVSVNVGWYTSLSTASLAAMLTELVGRPAVRLEMSERGRSVVNGCGAETVVELLTSEFAQGQRSHRYAHSLFGE
jgi:UDP-2,4-diacetamido-2,4,6-trideoxy-beta-L-altropyranose hydrolase